MRRRFGIEPAAQRPGQTFGQGRLQIVNGEVRQRGLRGEGGHQPVDIRRERRVGEVRPLIPLGAAQEHHAIAPLRERLGPRQPVDAEARDAFGQEPRGLVIGLDLAGLLIQRDCAEAARTPRAQAERRIVERHVVAALDAVGEACLDFGKRDRRRQHDAPLRGASREFGDRDEGFARQWRRQIDVAAAAVRERERAIVAVLRDPVRVGEGEDKPERQALSLPSPLRGGVGGGGDAIRRSLS